MSEKRKQMALSEQEQQQFRSACALDHQRLVEVTTAEVIRHEPGSLIASLIGRKVIDIVDAIHRENDKMITKALAEEDEGEDYED